MDGQEFAMYYQCLADIYATSKHSVSLASSNSDPSDRIAIFTCSYVGFDEVNQSRLRRRMNDYFEYNSAQTVVDQGLLSPCLARLSQYSNDDGARLLTMGIPYGTMTLYDLMVSRNQSGERFSEEEVWRVLAALCDAARFMHSEEKPETELEDIPHLAIYPKNIFLYDSGARVRLGYPYVCPATSFKDPDNYQAFQQFEEAHFAAPEFLDPESQGSCACDMFSIGMIGYAMMVGSTPFDARDLATLRAFEDNSGMIALPNGLAYSQELIDFIDSLLNLDPYARPRAAQLHAHPKILGCITENGPVPDAVIMNKTREIQPGHSDATELMMAAKTGDLEGVIAYMHQAGSKDLCGRTALMYAAEHGHASCVSAIINDVTGYNEVRCQDKYMWTANMYAAQNGHANCVSLLGEEYGMTRRDGATALFTAVFWNRLECVQILAPVEASLATNDKYWQGEAYTAAMEAARWGRPECLAVILQYVERSTTDRSGHNVDHYAENPWEHVSTDKAARVRQVLGH